MGMEWFQPLKLGTWRYLRKMSGIVKRNWRSNNNICKMRVWKNVKDGLRFVSHVDECADSRE